MIFLIVLFVFPFTHQFDFVLDAYEKECFTEELTEIKNIEIMYEVIEGGFLDVDLNSIQRRSNGHYIVKANSHGVYEFCFSNEHSSITNKVVVFNIRIETDNKVNPEIEGNEKEKITKRLENAMFLLSAKTGEMRRGQEFMAVRDKAHSRLNLESHSYITYWAIFECLTFVCVTSCQIWYLKRFFEVRRIV